MKPQVEAVAPPPAPALRAPQRICMVVYSAYETDNRVRRYAEALARRGDHVDVIALGGRGAPLGQATLRGVTVHRIQPREMNERHKWTYFTRMLRFLAASGNYLRQLHRKARYHLIHVHNMPDFLVFSAWYPKLTGAKVILDIHDIVPELFANKFGTDLSNRYVRLLTWLEKASCRFADHVIVSNHLWRDKLIARSVGAEKCSVYVNNVDPSIFFRRSRTRDDGRFILLFPGSFQWHQGLDVAIEAMPHILKQLPNAELHLYGSGTPDVQAGYAQSVERLKLGDSVKFFPVVPLEQVGDVIANADVGVVPKRADSFGNEAYSTKTMEFMSQGLPVVVSRTKIDSYYFDDSVVRFFPSGDSRALADAVLEIAAKPGLRAALAANGLAYAEQNSWACKQDDYFALVDSLLAGTRAAAPQRLQMSPDGKPWTQKN